MPVQEDRLHNPKSCNRWFAVSSVLMTASILWLIQVDYARPWREFQKNYFVGKAALAHLDYVDATREDRVKELQIARQRLLDETQLVRETSAGKLATLAHDIEEANLEFTKVDLPLSRARQVLDVTKDTFERAKEIHGPNHSTTKAAHEQLQREEAEIEEMRKQSEHWEDRKKQLEQELKELNKGVREADARVRTLEQAAAEARQKDMSFRGVLWDEGLLGDIPFVRAIINAPLLDFVAPKNTPGREQVNQLVLPDVRQRLNYLETYTTDRCTTCHVAMDDPQFSKDYLARSLEEALPAVSERLQREGKPGFEMPAPPVLAGGAAPLPTGEVTKHWELLTPQQQNEYLNQLLALYNAYLSESGRKTIHLEQPVLAHPDLDLYVTIDSPHPMNKMGCSVCHEGNPQETDFVFAAHSPRTHEQQHEWEEEYYIHMLGVPNITFETMAHFWDRPMRLPEYTEAGCAKCHSQITDIGRFQGERKGAHINLGQQLFREVGCINCHNDNALAGSRRVGPDLSHVAAKLTPGFVSQWAYFPQKFRPSTLMPHFFMQENNDQTSANQFDTEPVERTETEVAAITKYLFAVSKPWQPIEKPADVQGDIERGRTLFRDVGCLACHANLAEFGESWITQDMMHRERIPAETAGFRYKGMTYEQRVRYAMDHFLDVHQTYLAPESVRFNPDAPYNTPTFTRFAPELSVMGSKVRPEWLYSWLIEPSQYAPDTKMPSLRLSPQEAADLTAYLMSLKHDSFEPREFEMTAQRWEKADELIFSLLSAQRSERRSRGIMRDEGGELTQTLVSLIDKSFKKQEAYDLIQSMSLEDKKLVFLGNKMVLHYGCYACHKIPGFEEASPPGTDLSAWAEKPISQLDFAFYDHAFHDMRHEKEEVFGYLYPRDNEQLNHLSPLPKDEKEQITHTHGAFAHHKMLNPRIWDRQKLKKPYDKLKMPNFYFSEQEADALTTYLLSRIPPRVNEPLQVKYEGTELGPIAEGRMLAREFNCISCHEIEDNVPTVQQYFRRKIGQEVRFDETNAPPTLRGEGAKTQHQWLRSFLKNVVTLRPWLQVRMPTFDLTTEQSTALVAYFASLSSYDSKKLAQALAPVDEAIANEAKAAAEAKGADSSAGAFPWFDQEPLARFVNTLRRWALDRRLMRPNDLDALRQPPDRFAAAHANLLERTRFMKNLYAVEYPFVEPPEPMSRQERFDHGLAFLNDMGCLKCHVLGEMLPGPAKNLDEFIQVYRLDGVRGEGAQAEAILNGHAYPVGSVINECKLISAANTYHSGGDIETKAIVEGVNANGETERVILTAASAPNLALTYERLRREWVYRWMLEPQWIQPGTKMPQNFPGGKSPYEGDAKYPESSAEQIDLLVDTLFDAGRVNARVPLPKVPVPAAKTEEFDEEGEGKKSEEFED